MGRDGMRGNLLLFLTLFLISGLLFLADRRGWFRFWRGVIQRPIIALQAPLFEVSIRIHETTHFLSLGSSDQRILELEGRLRQLAVDQGQLTTCLEENKHLKKLLGAPLSPSWKFLEAKVVGFSEKMRIDKGEEDGVGKGMVVIAENILVGRIVSTQKSDSLVQLINDPEVKIPVIVKRANSEGIQARGLLVSQFGGRLVLDRVLQNEDIQKGDLVVTNGEENWLADLIIGQIDEVLSGNGGVYQQATVTPLVDYQSLRVVFVVLR